MSVVLYCCHTGSATKMWDIAHGRRGRGNGLEGQRRRRRSRRRRRRRRRKRRRRVRRRERRRRRRSQQPRKERKPPLVHTHANQYRVSQFLCGHGARGLGEEEEKKCPDQYCPGIDEVSSIQASVLLPHRVR